MLLGRVLLGALGLWGSGSLARGDLCGWAPAERIADPIRALVPVGHRCWALPAPCLRLSRPPPAGNPARAPPCCSGAPVQCSTRGGLQVARTCPKMPAAGVLKAYCQGGLLPLPRPSCWGLHVRGPMGKLSLTRLVYQDGYAAYVPPYKSGTWPSQAGVCHSPVDCGSEHPAPTATAGFDRRAREPEFGPGWVLNVHPPSPSPFSTCPGYLVPCIVPLFEVPRSRHAIAHRHGTPTS